MAKQVDSGDESFNDGEEGSGTSGADGGKGISDKVTDIPFQDVDASKLKIKGVDDDYGKSDDDDDETVDSGKNVDESSEEESEEEEEEAEEEKEGEESEEKDGKSTTKEGETEKQSYTQEEFVTSVNSMISKVSKNGSVKTLNDIPKVLAENEALKQQVEKLAKKEVEFPNPKAKVLYDYSIKAAGFETQAAKQYLHVVGLGEIKDLSDKDALCEAFCLSRPDLSRKKAEEIHDRMYAEKYPDLQNDLLQQDSHGVATREARAQLVKMQEEFSSAKSEQPAADVIDPKVTEAIHKRIDDFFEDFGGMSFSFGEGENEQLQLPLSSEEESEFKEILKDPMKLIEALVDECVGDDGEVDTEKWAYEMFTIFKRHSLAQEANKLGRTLGQIKVIETKKNVVKTTKRNEGSSPSGKKVSFEDTFANAVLAGK